MPLIEELPVTHTVRASHGWTYVPDTGTSAPAAVQLTSRKRNRDGTTSTAAAHTAAHNLTAKQEKAIQQRLNDLNRENHREVTIHIPKRETARGAGQRKTTSNVKRILAYQRTFQHYLANEEAGVNVYGAAGHVVPSSSSARNGAQAVPTPQKAATDTKRRSAATTAPSAQKGGTRRTSSLRQSRNSAVKAEEADDTSPQADVEMTDLTTQLPISQPPSPAASQKSPSKTRPAQPYDPSLDQNPLLKTLNLPKPPTDRVMQALLAEPPLSYTAARAKPLDNPSAQSNGASGFTQRTGNSTLQAKPNRWFCAMCGYWGKVRCKYGCGERVCGLMECWRGHEAVCALAATAY